MVYSYPALTAAAVKFGQYGQTNTSTVTPRPESWGDYLHGIWKDYTNLPNYAPTIHEPRFIDDWKAQLARTWWPWGETARKYPPVLPEDTVLTYAGRGAAAAGTTAAALAAGLGLTGVGGAAAGAGATGAGAAGKGSLFNDLINAYILYDLGSGVYDAWQNRTKPPTPSVVPDVAPTTMPGVDTTVGNMEFPQITGSMGQMGPVSPYIPQSKIPDITSVVGDHLNKLKSTTADILSPLPTPIGSNPRTTMYG